MRRIASLFVPIISLALSAAACGDSGGDGKTPSDTSTGGDATTAGDATTSSPEDSSQTTTPQDSSQTTTAQDTTTTPDVTEDLGDDLCGGIFACVADNCASATTQAELQGCVADCSEDSAQFEVQAFSDFFQCQGTCVQGVSGQTQPTPEQEKEIYACILEDCSSEAVACQAGPEFGTKTCPQLNSCLFACGVDCSQKGQRDCWASATEDANTNLSNLQICLQSQCADKSGAALQTCATDAQKVPPCKTWYDNCFGDVGAAPGAGGGGSSGGRWDMRNMWGMKAWMKFAH